MTRLKKTLLLLSLVLNSCVIIDTKPLGYSIKNCTNDTLLINLTNVDTLNDDIYWKAYSEDSITMTPDDTTTVYIHGKRVSIYNMYRLLPNTESRGSYSLFYSDTCYLYAIKWQIATHYPLEEIRSRKLYDKVAVTKRDFNHRLYEYHRYP